MGISFHLFRRIKIHVKFFRTNYAAQNGALEIFAGERFSRQAVCGASPLTAAARCESEIF